MSSKRNVESSDSDAHVSKNTSRKVNTIVDSDDDDFVGFSKPKKTKQSLDDDDDNNDKPVDVPIVVKGATKQPPVAKKSESTKKEQKPASTIPTAKPVRDRRASRESVEERDLKRVLELSLREAQQNCQVSKVDNGEKKPTSFKKDEPVTGKDENDDDEDFNFSKKTKKRNSAENSASKNKRKKVEKVDSDEEFAGSSSDGDDFNFKKKKPKKKEKSAEKVKKDASKTVLSTSSEAKLDVVVPPQTVEKESDVANVESEPPQKPLAEKPGKKKAEKRRSHSNEDEEDEEEYSDASNDSEDDFKKKSKKSKTKNTDKGSATKAKSSTNETKSTEPPSAKSILTEKTNKPFEAKVVLEKLPSKSTSEPEKVAPVACVAATSKTSLINKFSASSVKPPVNTGYKPPASTTPLGRIELHNPSPVHRVGLSRNSKVRPLHPNAKLT